MHPFFRTDEGVVQMFKDLSRPNEPFLRPSGLLKSRPDCLVLMGIGFAGKLSLSLSPGAVLMPDAFGPLSNRGRRTRRHIA